MRGGAGGKRRATAASIERQHHLFNSRDSDVSQRSSISFNRTSDLNPEKSSKIRTINSFLSSHSFPITLRSNPVPSVKDVTETLKFLLSAADYDFDTNKWDEELIFFLKSYNCPFKITKSTLRAPTPHNWPTVVAVANWLVELASLSQRISLKSAIVPDSNSLNSLAIQSYHYYIRGEDDLVNNLDSEFIGKLESEKDNVKETIDGCQKVFTELESKLESLRKGPSRKETVEKVKSDLEKDVEKLSSIVKEYKDKTRGVEKLVEEKEKELKAKEEERKLISEENKELKKSVEVQNFSTRDVERMRRELQVIERDVCEAQIARDGWEQKSWELNSQIRNQLHQIQMLSIDCNKALRRLKIDIQFVVNDSGRSHADVIGVDYKTVLKPALSSFYDSIKGSKVEELRSLQHQMTELASKIESKKSSLESIQLQINALEEKMKLVKNETQELATKCDFEAKTMLETVQNEALSLEAVEKEAAEYVKASEARLEEAVKQSGEEVQACAAKLFKLIDSISKHKEYMDSKISEIKTGVADTAVAISAIHRASLKRQLDGQ